MAGEKQFSNSADETPESILKRKRRLGRDILGTNRADSARAQPPKALNLAFEQLVPRPRKQTKKPETAAENAEAGNAEAALSPEEQAEATSQLIRTRAEAVNTELGEANPEDVAALEADAQYLGNVEERIDGGEAAAWAIDTEYAAATGLSPEPVEGEFGAPPGVEGEVLLHQQEDEPSSVIERDQNTGLVPEAAETETPGFIALIVDGLLRNKRRNQVAEHDIVRVRRSLEREVRQLHGKLLQREQQVRQLVRERDNTVGRPAPEGVRTKPNGTETIKPVAFEAKAVAVTVTEVRQMPFNKVLKLAENIKVGSKNIRQLHDENKISERGIRHIVEVWAADGNIRDAVKLEVLLKAIGPELDPMLRDRLPNEAQPVSASGSRLRSDDAEPASSIAANQIDPEHPRPYSLAHERYRLRSAPSRLIIANIVALIVLMFLLVIFLIVLLSRK